MHAALYVPDLLRNQPCRHQASCTAVVATHDSKPCQLYNVRHAHTAATLLSALLPDALRAHISKTCCPPQAVLYKGLWAKQHTVQFYGTVTATTLLLQAANVLNTAAGVAQKAFYMLIQRSVAEHATSTSRFSSGDVNS